MSFEVVPVDKPADLNVIIGQAHFIKTVDDLHEVLAGVSPHLRFGIGFCEASSKRLVRRSGNDEELTGLAAAGCRRGKAARRQEAGRDRFPAGLPSGRRTRPA